MNIKPLLLLLFLWASLGFASAQDSYQNLVLTSAKPQPGQTASFTYDATNTEMAGKEIEAIAYVFSNDKVEALDVPLRQKKGKWEGSVPTNSENRSFFLYFKSGEDYDNNKGKGYAFLLYDAKQKPVPGAWGSMATALTDWSRMMNMDRDLQAASARLEKEFNLYPESKRDFARIYLFVLSQEKTAGTDSLLSREAETLMADPKLDVAQMTDLYYFFKHNEQEERARQMEEKVKQLEPKGRLVQQERFHEIYQEKALDKKIALANAFVTEFPESDQADWALEVVVREMSEQGQYEQLKAFLLENPQAATWSVYNEAAWSLAEADQQMALAQEFATKGYALARAGLETPKEKKPDWLTQKQWHENRARQLGMVADTYGYILMKQGKLAESLPLFEEAVKLQQEQNIDINKRYVEALMKNGQTTRAKTALEHYISTGHSNADMKQYLREIYKQEKGGEAGYDAYLQQLEAPALEKMRAGILKKLISEPAPQFALQDLEGNKVSLADLKGKTVIVDFWATWCGPCINSFPSMQQAVDKFRNDEQVAFVFINSWERGEDSHKKVSDFITKNNYNFRVLMDTDNSTIESFKVEGIPTKFVIDKQGNIRYRSVGFGGNEEAVVTELSMLIELLR